MIGLQWFFTYEPSIIQTVQLASLKLTEWWFIVGWGLLTYGVVGFEKTLRYWISHKPKE